MEISLNGSNPVKAHKSSALQEIEAFTGIEKKS